MGPPCSLQIPRVCRYYGYRSLTSDFVYEILTLFDWASHPIRLSSMMLLPVLTPSVLLLLVWPLSLSLATTHEISVDFSSSSYLDVSVQRVPLIYLCIHHTLTEYCSAGFPHSDIHGSNACFRLTVAFRRSLRPSSALSAKASPLRSF